MDSKVEIRVPKKCLDLAECVHPNHIFYAKRARDAAIRFLETGNAEATGLQMVEVGAGAVEGIATDSSEDGRSGYLPLAPYESESEE